MPQIISIKDLQDAEKIAQMCSESDEPIYVTKDGGCDMVIMSAQAYEERVAMSDIYAKLAEGEDDVRSGRVSDALASLKSLRAKYDV